MSQRCASERERARANEQSRIALRASRHTAAAALTSRGFDGTRASLLLADEQGVLRTVLGHHDDYDRVREKLLVARKVALGVAVGR